VTSRMPLLFHALRRCLLHLSAMQATVLLLALLVLGGCGQSKPNDSFVGTWTWPVEGGKDPRWIITYDAGEYTIYSGFPGDRDYTPTRHYVRSGDTLRNTKFPGETLRLEEDGDALFLRIDDGSPLIKKARLTRVSYSTATPVPVP